MLPCRVVPSVVDGRWRGDRNGGGARARCLVRFDWTDQGIRDAKDSVKRVGQARAAFQKRGIIIESVSWTLGSQDLVAIMSAPDGETSAAGNVRTTTLRAVDEAEFGAIPGRVG